MDNELLTLLENIDAKLDVLLSKIESAAEVGEAFKSFGDMFTNGTPPTMSGMHMLGTPE